VIANYRSDAAAATAWRCIDTTYVKPISVTCTFLQAEKNFLNFIEVVPGNSIYVYTRCIAEILSFGKQIKEHWGVSQHESF